MTTTRPGAGRPPNPPHRARDDARAALAICLAVDRGDVDALAGLIQEGGARSWVAVFASESPSGIPPGLPSIGLSPLGLEPRGDAVADRWIGIAEQALYLLWDTFRAVADLVGCPAERLLQAELDTMLVEEAAGGGIQSLIVACLQQRLNQSSNVADSHGLPNRFKPPDPEP